MSSRTTLSAADLIRVVSTFHSLLLAQKEVINRLNVYPVPDGDTGTNMSLTMQAVERALATLPATATVGEVTKAISHASLLGARGNSGVILSQLLRGLTQGFDPKGVIDLPALRAGLVRADELARQAVSKPVEGTILSIARAAANGAASGDTLASAVVAARDAAVTALALTPEQLPVLKEAGVVDSGGTGLVLLFDALCHVVADTALPETPIVAEAAPLLEASPVRHVNTAALAELRFEVMFLLEGDDAGISAFRTDWESLGDSIVLVGGDGLWNCHIHTDHVGPAIEAALAVGRPREIRVTDLLEQAGEEGWVLAAAPPTPAPVTAVVAVAVGDGVAALFRDGGARQIVVGGQTMNPSTAELVDAVLATGSRSVVILPNNKNIRAVAEQVDALVDVDVRVVATTSVVEGLAAMVGYQSEGALDANVAAMTTFAQGVRAGEVTQAVRATRSGDLVVATGDWIGLAADGVVTVADSAVGAAVSLIASLASDDSEILTVVVGAGVAAADLAQLRVEIATRFPALNLDVHHGGQPLYSFLIGVE